MAEAFLNRMGNGEWVAESAGVRPASILPSVVSVMKEIGYDLSGNSSDSVFEFYRRGRLYDYVITVCDDAVESECPVFPGITRRLHWPFPDPSALQGSGEEKTRSLRRIRDAIGRRVREWLNDRDDKEGSE